MYISKESFVEAVARCCPDLNPTKVFSYVEEVFFLSQELGYSLDGEDFTTRVIESAKEIQDYGDD